MNMLELFFFSSSFRLDYFREEWIKAIESINQHTTPHLKHQLPNNTASMVTNDDADNTENECPSMNEVFTRRPV